MLFSITVRLERPVRRSFQPNFIRAHRPPRFQPPKAHTSLQHPRTISADASESVSQPVSAGRGFVDSSLMSKNRKAIQVDERRENEHRVDAVEDSAVAGQESARVLDPGRALQEGL